MEDLAQAIPLENRVTVLAPPSAASPRDAVVDGIRIIRLREPLRQGRVATTKTVIALNAMLSRLRREGDPADILHAHNFLTGAIPVLVGRVRRIPVVITENQSRTLTADLSGYEIRLARFAYGRASRVCPVSELVVKQLRSLQPGGRYEVVPDVVDVDRLAAIGWLDRRSPATRIVAVSNLVRRKGLGYLIEAVHALSAEGRELELSIVGDGPERTSLEAQAEGKPVTLLGPRSREEIVELLRAADVFAMPTLADPFGIAAVEAFAARVPVVVTCAAGSAKLLGQLGAIVVDPKSTAAFSEGLARAIDSPPLVSAASVDRLRAYCGFQAVGAKFASVYREISGPLHA